MIFGRRGDVRFYQVLGGDRVEGHILVRRRPMSAEDLGKRESDHFPLSATEDRDPVSEREEKKYAVL